jgi:uncharacterized membrane protein
MKRLSIFKIGTSRRKMATDKKLELLKIEYEHAKTRSVTMFVVFMSSLIALVNAINTNSILSANVNYAVNANINYAVILFLTGIALVLLNASHKTLKKEKEKYTELKEYLEK